MKAIVTTINIDAFEIYDSQKGLLGYNNEGENRMTYIYFDSDIIFEEESGFLNSFNAITQEYIRSPITERNLYLMQNEINHLITEFINKGKFFDHPFYPIEKKIYIIHKEPFFKELQNYGKF